VAAIANPKMPIFFTSLLPHFGASFAALALHGAICTAAVLVGFGLHLAVERR
jgi:threonine/homoserine/homoserine lactone efflux protein